MKLIQVKSANGIPKFKTSLEANKFLQEQFASLGPWKTIYKESVAASKVTNSIHKLRNPAQVATIKTISSQLGLSVSKDSNSSFLCMNLVDDDTDLFLKVIYIPYMSLLILRAMV